jgi:hypothetical protein
VVQAIIFFAVRDPDKALIHSCPAVIITRLILKRLRCVIIYTSFGFRHTLVVIKTSRAVNFLGKREKKSGCKKSAAGARRRLIAHRPFTPFNPTLAIFLITKNAPTPLSLYNNKI